jgi:N-terminal domain of reverse transcriptase
MTAASPTESWETLDWKHIQKNVYRLQKRIYRASRPEVLVTRANVLRSRVLGNSQARLCSGGGRGDSPTYCDSLCVLAFPCSPS